MQSSVPLIGSTETPAPPCDPWKFWASIAWTVAAIGGSLVLILFYIVVRDICCGITRLDAADEYASTLYVAMISTPVAVAVLAFAIRRARCRFFDYLALYRPRWRELLFSIFCLAALSCLTALLPDFSDGNPTMEDYEHARDAGVLFLWSIDAVIIAPITEEIIFRGFLWRGLAASRVGIAGAMIVSAAGWAVLHVQYDVFAVAQICIFGIFLGLVRWRSGSTTITMILHALNNTAVIVMIAGGWG